MIFHSNVEYYNITQPHGLPITIFLHFISIPTSKIHTDSYVQIINYWRTFFCLYWIPTYVEFYDFFLVLNSYV